MGAQANHQLLNSLLNRLRFSLLQYVGECSTWVPGTNADRQKRLEGLIARQQFAAERIGELLSDRGDVVVVDNYPGDRSALHFVSIDFVKPLLIGDEEKLLRDLRSGLAQLTSDPEASRLIEQISGDEAVTLDTLRNL